ncbi:immunoglobulin-binding protein 1 [Aphidius gifuensis]|uniref:immunoglobulin-binding protein 1 n=1 Tax=Aphidius gifuensis TaxID=684658 RepID=UPI001CDD5961|nr:immunoglobulin-binding protein 1 [Aphidius gifuensis]
MKKNHLDGLLSNLEKLRKILSNNKKTKRIFHAGWVLLLIIKKMENTENTNQECLSEMFDNGFKLFNNLSKTEEPTNSLKVQIDIKKCIKIFEESTKLVSIADIFSTNESFEEIPTEQIKYYLLPAFLGTLATKLADRDNRMHNVEISEIYFYDFLERVKSYGIVNIELPKRNDNDNKEPTSDTSVPSGSQELSNENDKTVNEKKIEEMVNTRANTLQKYKKEKELKDKLQVLEQNMNSENIDDEMKRNYYTTLIKLYVFQAFEELNSLSQEKEILKYMAKIKVDGVDNKDKKYVQPKLKPIIITRNEVQKKVYGAGYPSLPVMSVSEFYEKKVADGEWPAGGEPGTTVGGKALTESTSVVGEYKEAQEDPDKIEKERKIEEDSEEFLAQQRAMDEYKDTHRRGWGNRHNRS